MTRDHASLPPDTITLLGDAVADQDALGLEEYAREHAADLREIHASKLPIVVSVEAPWGRGETSMIEQILEASAATHGPDEHGRPRKPIVAWLNPWMYDDADQLWSSLAARFKQEMRRELGPGAFYRKRLIDTLGKAVRTIWNIVSTPVPPAQHWDLRVAILILGGLAGVYTFATRDWWLPLFDPASGGFLDIGFIVKATIGSVTLLAALTAILGLIGDVLTVSSQLDGHNSRPPRPIIDRFQEDFDVLVRRFCNEHRRTLVVIDDFDRCKPAVVAATIRALNAVLTNRDKTKDGASNGKAKSNAHTDKDEGRANRKGDDKKHGGGANLIFLIAMDRDRIASAIAHEMQDREGDTPPDAQFGHEYLDKFVQHTIQVPRAEAGQLNQFVEKLVRNKNPFHPSVSRLGAEIFGLAYRVLENNPRRIKRFVNTYAAWLRTLERLNRISRVPKPGCVTEQQLVVVTALTQRFPGLRDELTKDPENLLTNMIEGLEAASDSLSTTVTNMLYATGVYELLQFKGASPRLKNQRSDRDEQTALCHGLDVSPIFMISTVRDEAEEEAAERAQKPATLERDPAELRPAKTQSDDTVLDVAGPRKEPASEEPRAEADAPPDDQIEATEDLAKGPGGATRTEETAAQASLWRAESKLEKLEQSGKADHNDVLQARVELLSAMSNADQDRRAAELAEQVLPMLRELWQDQPLRLIPAMQQIATIFRYADRYLEAIDVFAELESIIGRSAGNRSDDMVRLLEQKGITHRLNGDYHKSLVSLRAAVTASEQSNLPAWDLQPAVLSRSVAASLRLTGAPAKALALTIGFRQFTSETLPNPERLLALADSLQSDLLADSGLINDARSLIESTIERLVTDGGEESPLFGDALYSRGHIAHLQSEIDEAKRCFGMSLKLSTAALGADAPDALLSRHQLAVVDRTEGRLTESLDELLRIRDLEQRAGVSDRPFSAVTLLEVERTKVLIDPEHDAKPVLSAMLPGLITRTSPTASVPVRIARTLGRLGGDPVGICREHFGEANAELFAQTLESRWYPDRFEIEHGGYNPKGPEGPEWPEGFEESWFDPAKDDTKWAPDDDGSAEAEPAETDPA
ncbi:MAG: P-loop NTPase fold protein [Planctomycetota bacterium]